MSSKTGRSRVAGGWGAAPCRSGAARKAWDQPASVVTFSQDNPQSFSQPEVIKHNPSIASEVALDNPTLPFDPIERAKRVEAVVLQDGKRQYYRFRPAPYYGGISTADAHGCDLLCAYCWNYDRNKAPSSAYGTFYSPEDVAAQLLSIARKKGYHTYRLTGSESILGLASLQHVLRVKDAVLQADPSGQFIIETNGLMLGHQPELCTMLSASGGNVRVRLCVKGKDPESFEQVTGANGVGFYLQLHALSALSNAGVRVQAAFLADLFTPSDIEELQSQLAQWWPDNPEADLELEHLERYPPVMKHLKERRIHLPTSG